MSDRLSTYDTLATMIKICAPTAIYSKQALVLLQGMVFPAALHCNIQAIRGIMNDITLTKDIGADGFARVCRQMADILNKVADNILDESTTTEVYR